ncbi:hypothetical protein PB2503_01102 [Parvularcula bermudensis HTCC2503]|uniref:DUF2007 domain-containing protein n=1 Tax=Parvularcula bermudensis (strain ATCC BAA-594 / HTCC2503 / KCTC 12087) TaxID=314260 RepID=E0TB96_PARBH|nr:hypothetical protein [Parvularcula bermudensis]ADM08300.1 hypothetical protein PB2503_01102 [Parvularcula bermudensis HTCC2503]
MKEIARFYDPEEALIAAGFLRAQGLSVHLADEATLAAQPHLRIGLGGYRLLADQRDAHMARIALNTIAAASSSPDTPPAERSDGAPDRCPQCGGPLRRRRHRLLPALLLLTGALFPFSRAGKELRCGTCGHKQQAP